MIITLIIISALLSLIHYLGIESVLVYIVGLPIEYYIGTTILLIIVRIILALYRVIPALRRTFRRAENLLNRYDNVGSKGFNPQNQIRKFSTTSVQLQSRVGRRGSGPLPNVIKEERFNLLDITKSKFQVVRKMVPLSQKFLGTTRFKNSIRLMYYLALERTGRLAYRANCVQIFLAYVLKYKAAHGIEFTIKWMKASYVAIQKELGQDGIDSLRALNPDLPLPALQGRLPRLIPAFDRAQIREGNPAVIRFWSSLFNLYRILQCPGELKLSTITNPFSGDPEYLESLKSQVSYFPFFNHIKGYSKWKDLNLSPSKLLVSKSASPSNKISFFGSLTDIYNLVTHRMDLWTKLHEFAYSTYPVQTPFMAFLADGYDIISDLVNKDADRIVTGKISGKGIHFPYPLRTKPSISGLGPDGVGGLSQLAIKEEAAGKVRVFALIDAISQSFLAPLHDALFNVLRSIPNDGTFDQDASVKRCQNKAVESNCAYSFDLTAATDRLPVQLSASIINAIFQNPHIGEYWRYILCERTFALNDKVAAKYKVPAGPYTYAVGQPMGGLSSWAMLALTHHWIVQYAAFRASKNSNSGWYLNYEILGDDLVIFDADVAREYLVVMQGLGCEINLNKSISSVNRPVFEFAKRTCWGHKIVSGISFNQLAANTTVGARIANVLAFAKQGSISGVSVMLSLLTRDALTKVSEMKSRLTSVGISALLSTLYHQGRATLKEVMTAFIHPKDGFFGEVLDLPKTAALRFSYSRLMLDEDAEISESLPWSHKGQREDFFEEHKSFFTMQVLTAALSAAEEALRNWKKWLHATSQRMLFFPSYRDPKDGPFTWNDLQDIPEPDTVDLLMRLHDWTGQALGIGITSEDPAELLEEAKDLLVQFQYDEMLSLEEALSFEKRVTGFRDQIEILPTPEVPEEIIESAPIIQMVRYLKGLNRLRGSQLL